MCVFRLPGGHQRVLIHPASDLHDSLSHINNEEIIKIRFHDYSDGDQLHFK